MAEYENEAPTGKVADDSYVSRSGHKDEEIPVMSDEAKVEDPIDESKADTDEQLGKHFHPRINTWLEYLFSNVKKYI